MPPMPLIMQARHQRTRLANQRETGEEDGRRDCLRACQDTGASSRMRVRSGLGPRTSCADAINVHAARERRSSRGTEFGPLGFHCQ